MAYGEAAGSRVCIKWDPPIRKVADRFQLQPQMSGAELIGENGQWSNCRIWCKCPASWLDVVFELYAVLGQAEVLVDVRTPRQATPSTLDGGVTYSTVLLSALGLPCDGFRVRMRGVLGEVPLAIAGLGELGMLCWGTEAGGAGAGEAGAPNDVPQRAGVGLAGAAVANAVAILGRTKLRMVYGINTAAAGTPTLYVMLFDSAVIPVLGTPPTVAPIAVNPTLDFSWSVPGDGDGQFQTGVAIGLSTTAVTYTAAGANLIATLYYDQ